MTDAEPRMKMTVYKKFKIATLTMMMAQPVFAITVEPVQVQSAPGELLYAEMNFRQSDINIPIEVSLATPEDLMTLGTTHQPPGHLNFFTRRSSNGTGVITITSSRPITQNDLNFVVKVKEGNAARLQHIKTTLKPKTDLLKASISANERTLTPVVVVNENEIGLNLPVSTQYKPAAANTKAMEKPLAVQRLTPPPLSPNSIPQTTSITTPVVQAPVKVEEAITAVNTRPVASTLTTPTPIAEPAMPAIQQKPLASNSLQKNPVTTTAQTKTQVAQAASAAPVAQPNQDIPTQKVQSQKPVATYPAAPHSNSSDPLVKKYADEQVAKQKQVPPKKPPQAAPAPVKHSPQASPTSIAKASYVVQSNESLWKIAARIAQEQNRGVGEVMQQIKKNNEQAFIGGDANRLKRGAALNLNIAPAQQQPITVKTSELAQVQNKAKGSTKYRLNQAEMSLVAENQQETKQLSANQNTLDRQTSKELSLKVMTVREKTVKLQRNVTELELALNQKDQRIQLLNARLARLQQQLKAQQADKKAN
jgi:pilus assembly protein FimV